MSKVSLGSMVLFGMCPQEDEDEMKSSVMSVAGTGVFLEGE
jgi:hypothetical protein